VVASIDGWRETNQFPLFLLFLRGGQNSTKPSARSPFVDDFASSKRLEHAALEQIVFGPLAGLSDGRRLAPCSFVFEMCAARAAGAQSCRHIGVL
jgi:hypothetical protein